MPKLTIEDIFELIARDGLIETIEAINTKQVMDDTLREMFDQAQDLINRIEAYVEDNRIQTYEYDDEDDNGDEEETDDE